MSQFIGYPRDRVLAVFESVTTADDAVRALEAAGVDATAIERFAGSLDADRFDSTGHRNGIAARVLRATQFGLMDQLPALAWYEAALRSDKVVIAVRAVQRPATLRAVQALTGAGGHFINRFGRLQTEEFARWRGPEPRVPNVMKS